MSDTALDSASLLAYALGAAGDPRAPHRRTTPVGAWRTSDGSVRLDLHTDGTYAGKVAGRRLLPHGTYAVADGAITLHDDSGLLTPVAVLDGELEMAGHRLVPALP